MTYRMTRAELRKTDVNGLKSGDVMQVSKYEIELLKNKHRTFSLESRVMDAATWKYIDPFFWPVYIMDFLHGVHK